MGSRPSTIRMRSSSSGNAMCSTGMGGVIGGGDNNYIVVICYRFACVQLLLIRSEMRLLVRAHGVKTGVK